MNPAISNRVRRLDAAKTYRTIARLFRRRKPMTCNDATHYFILCYIVLLGLKDSVFMARQQGEILWDPRKKTVTSATLANDAAAVILLDCSCDENSLA